MSDPSPQRVNRRRFLLASGGAAASTTVAGQLMAVQQSVAALARQQPTNSADKFADLAGEYSLSESISYLNHAAIGTISRPVQAALADYVSLCETNPWLYIWGDAWAQPLAEVRSRAATVLGCAETEVAITHNTTETFNTLSLGLPLQQQDEVLFSSLNHAGASLPFEERARLGRYRVRRFDFPAGTLPAISADEIVSAYAEEIQPQTRLLVFPHLDNTLGIRHPVRQIADMARDRGVEFIAVDAAQTPGMLTLKCAEMNIDVLGTSGHKWLGGPKGTGLAYINQRIHETLQPWSVTWGQRQWSDSARRYEDYGTRNMPDVLALGDAIAFLGRLQPSEREARLRDLWNDTRERVAQSKTLRWNSPDDWELGGSLYSINVEKPANALAQTLYEQHGIVVRPFANANLNSLRVSPNVFTSKDQITQFLALVS